MFSVSVFMSVLRIWQPNPHVILGNQINVTVWEFPGRSIQWNSCCMLILLFLSLSDTVFFIKNIADHFFYGEKRLIKYKLSAHSNRLG